VAQSTSFIFCGCLIKSPLASSFGAIIREIKKGGPKGSTTKQSEAAEINGKQKPNTVADCSQKMYHFHCHFHFHFHAKRKYPPPPFSAHSAGRFLLLLPLTVFFWLRRSGIFLVLSFLWSRARAKIRKILFCLLFPRFLFLFLFFLFIFLFFQASNKRISISMPIQSGGMLFGRRKVGGLCHSQGDNENGPEARSRKDN